MSKDMSKTPKLTEAAIAEQAKKADTLKAALRENLRKRKAQAKAKKAVKTNE